MASVCTGALTRSFQRGTLHFFGDVDRFPSRLLGAGAAPRNTFNVKARTTCSSSNCLPQNGVAQAVLRRDLLIAAGLTGLAAADPTSSVTGKAKAGEEVEAEVELEPFLNAADGYSLLVPKGWVNSNGAVGTRRLVAFHPEGSTAANVTVLLTPLGADFTSLGSFGTAEAFGEALVNGQDRSYERKPGQKAVLLSSKASQGRYIVDYTIQKPGEAKVHLLSTVAVHFNGIYNLLYTLTAQFREEESAKFSSAFQKIAYSLNFTSS